LDAEKCVFLLGEYTKTLSEYSINQGMYVKARVACKLGWEEACDEIEKWERKASESRERLKELFEELERECF